MKLHITISIITLSLLLTSCLSDGINGPIYRGGGGGGGSSATEYKGSGFSFWKKKKKRRYPKNKFPKYGKYKKAPKQKSGFFGQAATKRTYGYGYGDNDSYYSAPKKKTSYYGSSYNKSSYQTKKKKSNYYNKSKSRYKRR